MEAVDGRWTPWPCRRRGWEGVELEGMDNDRVALVQVSEWSQSCISVDCRKLDDYGVVGVNN